MKSKEVIIFSTVEKIETEMFKKLTTHEDNFLREDIFYEFIESYYEVHFLRINEILRNIKKL